MALVVMPAEQAGDTDLSTLTVAKLQELAARLGIRGVTRMRKEEIVRVIEDKRRGLASSPDEPGGDRTPDPRAARTQAELMAALRLYRIWAGEPSFRQMERRLNRKRGPEGRIPASTLCAVINRDRLPRLAMLCAVIDACGGDEHDRDIFMSAWRQVKIRTVP